MKVNKINMLESKEHMCKARIYTVNKIHGNLGCIDCQVNAIINTLLPLEDAGKIVYLNDSNPYFTKFEENFRKQFEIVYNNYHFGFRKIFLSKRFIENTMEDVLYFEIG